MAYKLDVEAARQRRGVGDSTVAETSRLLAKEAKAREYGRKQAVLALSEALKDVPGERTLRVPFGGFGSFGLIWDRYDPGLVLCERVTPRTPGGSWSKEPRVNISGILFTPGKDLLYSYQAKKVKLSYAEDPFFKAKEVNSWGYMQPALRTDNLVLDANGFEVINLNSPADRVDRQVGLMAGRLSLEDLFADMITQRELTSSPFLQEFLASE